MKKLILFPGQGAQYAGMAKDIYENSPEGRTLLDEVFMNVDFDLKSIMFEEDERLNQTEYTQPALFAHSLAVLAATGLKGDIVLGHSLGELPALVHAGVISVKDGVSIVAKRGELMSESTGGGMAAVIGMEYGALSELCESMSDQERKIQPANINAPDQIVVSGDRTLVDELAAEAKAQGARRVMPLNVSGAFHSHLMEPAKVEFRKFIEDIPFNAPVIPVIQNVSAKAETDPETIKAQLIDQLTSPVRFVECIEAAAAAGVEEAVEVGPKKVLNGLVRKIDRSIKTSNIDTMEQVKEFTNG
ncbi:ACP S-malonyltransferase [Salinicoccus roseus]|uniref:Malonyl CoA-acyl carrier protein transacylase n=1 Tax=Salinicoccus roseus TaxID=45670 RepID=A0A265E9X5_9STAP|nr:ACP S-malonyltransferase [Salinicoccus roseus]OZT78382.1 [acyl-carrier-protein] S-malonyltransferase [Salinicoccus roseus]